MSMVDGRDIFNT